MAPFLAITAFAQKLNVPCGVAAPHNDWDDMVIFKPLLGTAPDATAAIPLPHKKLDIVGNWCTTHRVLGLSGEDSLRLLKTTFNLPLTIQQ